MQRFKNILYVTEYTEDETDALRTACQLAAENGARLTISSVLPTLPETLPEDRLADLKRNLQSVEEHRQSFFYSEVLKPFREADVEIQHLVFGGIPFIEIIRDVLEHKRDLVIVSASPMFADGRGFTGMVMHLIRKCPCPVWAIRTNRPATAKHVLAAVDVGVAPSINQELNRELLRIASSQAHRCEAKLDILHVWQVPGQQFLRGPLVKLSDSEWDALHKRTEDIHRERFAALIDDLDLHQEDIETHMVEGDAPKVITSKMESLGIDLVVMGTLSHGGVTGYFMGHTSEEILQNTRCSVLTVKPDTFVSPVTVNTQPTVAVYEEVTS